MTALAIALWVLGCASIFGSISQSQQAKHEMWTVPKLRHGKWAVAWMLVGITLILGAVWAVLS